MKDFLLAFFCLQGFLIVSFGLSNPMRGDGLFYKTEFAAEATLKAIVDQGVKFLFYPTGHFEMQGDQIQRKGFTWPQAEEDWQKRFQLEHFLVYELQSELFLGLSQNPVLLKRQLTELILEDLNYYQGKFSGVILRVDSLKLPSSLNLVEIRQELKKNGFKLGFMAPLDWASQDRPFWEQPPDLMLFMLQDSDLSRLEWLSNRASARNTPFFLFYDMQPKLKFREQFLIVPRSFFAETPVQEERILPSDTGLTRTLRFLKDTELSGLPFKKDEIAEISEPSLNHLNGLLLTFAALKPFWFSGTVLNLGPLSIRSILQNPLQLKNPLASFTIKDTDRGILIDLGLTNPNPVASSVFQGSAGIALFTEGLKIKQIEMGEFSDLQVFPMEGGRVYLFVHPGLAAFGKTSGLRVEFDTSSLSQGQIKLSCWLRTHGSRERLYSRNGASELLPQWQVLESGQTIWQP